MKASLNEVDPLRIRMIGAIFWAVLLVYLIPQWFQHPVEFSPDGMKPSGVVVAAADAAASSSVNNHDTTQTLFNRDKGSCYQA